MSIMSSHCIGGSGHEERKWEPHYVCSERDTIEGMNECRRPEFLCATQRVAPDVTWPQFLHFQNEDYNNCSSYSVRET